MGKWTNVHTFHLIASNFKCCDFVLFYFEIILNHDFTINRHGYMVQSFHFSENIISSHTICDWDILWEN